MKLNLNWVTRPMLISALILLSAMASSEAATLSVGSGKAETGQTVTIDIRLTNIPGTNISSINFDLLYDSTQVSFDKAITGKVVSEAGKSLSVSNPVPGELRVIIFGLNQNAIADGILAQMSFRINTTAKTGNVALRLKNAVASGPEAKSVTLKLRGGKINIKRGG